MSVDDGEIAFPVFAWSRMLRRRSPETLPHACR